MEKFAWFFELTARSHFVAVFMADKNTSVHKILISHSFVRRRRKFEIILKFKRPRAKWNEWKINRSRRLINAFSSKYGLKSFVRENDQKVLMKLLNDLAILTPWLGG